ncbi:phage tail tube protein [Lutibacter sp. Hel_I_33_5]|uniref:phage tail tube protein n=1 Tax=Lutibacter sp. Hel_I_33_5 TaxID=1566289 RepID=UPI0011A6127F|nr:phage tail tube protein [Lutibacter sp. Hel_I_33_5]TVZ55599.1 phage tail tube protein [Lutibacter sp. Hel_I_33_5]
MLAYEGKMRIKSGTKTFKHEIECNISMNVAMQELATKDIVGKNYNPQDLEWSMSGSGIADNPEGAGELGIKDLADAMKAKQLAALEMTDGVAGNMAISGNGYYESLTIKSANKEKVTYDFSIKGIGEPTFATNA